MEGIGGKGNGDSILESMKKMAAGYHNGGGGHGRGHRGARGSGGGGAKKPPRGLGPQGVRNLERLAAGAKEQWAATAVEVPSTEEPARKSQRPGEP